MPVMTAYMCVINAVCMTISPASNPHNDRELGEREDKRAQRDGNSSSRGQLEIGSAKQYNIQRKERREHSLAVAATRSQHRGAKKAHPRTAAARARRDERDEKKKSQDPENLVRCEKCQQWFVTEPCDKDPTVNKRFCSECKPPKIGSSTGRSNSRPTGDNS